MEVVTPRCGEFEVGFSDGSMDVAMVGDRVLVGAEVPVGEKVEEIDVTMVGDGVLVGAEVSVGKKVEEIDVATVGDSVLVGAEVPVGEKVEEIGVAIVGDGVLVEVDGVLVGNKVIVGASTQPPQNSARKSNEAQSGPSGTMAAKKT